MDENQLTDIKEVPTETLLKHAHEIREGIHALDQGLRIPTITLKERQGTIRQRDQFTQVLNMLEGELKKRLH